MNCRRAVRLLCLDAGGNLEPRRRPAAAEHLASCAACRSFRGDLEAALAAARSWEFPESQIGGEELRRSVWREIRKERARKRAFGALGFRSLITAAAAAACAALLVSLLSRRTARETVSVVSLPAPSPIASSPAPSPFTATSQRNTSIVYSRALSRPRRIPSAESGITRIEFRTPDPQVRIIWLLGREASEPSRVPPSGPKQEVS